MIPRFFIARIPGAYGLIELQHSGYPIVKLPADLTTAVGRSAFLESVCGLQIEFCEPDARARFTMAVSELVSGQVAAGTITDECREIFRAIARESMPEKWKPRRQARRDPMRKSAADQKIAEQISLRGVEVQHVD